LFPDRSLPKATPDREELHIKRGEPAK
jgi:hypothetical protein